MVIDLYMNDDPPFVNEELFRLVHQGLCKGNVEIGGDAMKKRVEAHDEWYIIINKLVLYS